MKITVFKDATLINELDFSDFIITGETSEFSIGRSSEAHIQIDDPQVSRNLAKLIFDGSKWSLNKISDYDIVLVNNVPMTTPIVEVSSHYIVNINQFKIVFDDLEIEKAVEETVEVELTEEIEEAPESPELINEELDSLMTNEEPVVEEPVEEETQAFDTDSFADEENEAEDSEDLFDTGESYDDQEYETSDDEFGDFGEETESEDYAVDTYDDDEDDAGDSTQVFSGFANFVLELFGEDVPYDNFNLDSAETYIGRDSEKCQIVLNDPEVSSVHAVIKKNKITCSLEDLQSANGTILNGKRINSKEISSGDEFIIGSTTFTVRIASDFLKSQQDMLMPVEEDQIIEVEEVIEVSDEDFDEDLIEQTNDKPAGKFDLKAMWANPEQRKKLIIYAFILVAAWFMLGDEESEEKKPNQKVDVEKKKKAVVSTEKKLSPEEEERAEALYQLATRYANEGNVAEAITEFERLFMITKDYKQAQTFYQLAKDKYAELEKAEQEKRAEEKRLLIQAKVKKLLEKAEVAVKERNVTLARGLFQQIKEIDPNNYDVANLELDINAYIKEKNKKELAEAQRKAERQRMLEALKPGEKLFLQEEWYKAIDALEIFISEKSIDEDLMKKAVDMLKASKAKLQEVTGPLIGKARSLKEAEDLKAAYDVYREVLQFNPNMLEARTEMDEINETLTKRARKIYRRALISESLGSFEEAKEMFQEVQQITPTDNEYYYKAKKRLMDL